jgi:hypothetical protein
MKFLKNHCGATGALASLIALAVVAGCASTSVTNRDQVASSNLPRPGQIWIYPFAATPDEVRPESSLAGQSPADSQPDPEQVAEGQKLAAQIASGLVEKIHDMGLPAAIGTAGTRPQLNDLVIEGSILSVQAGSAAKRVAIGFSSGQSEMKVAVEGYQMTATGLRKLGSGDVGSAGNKTPGSAVGLAVLVATANPAGLIISTGVKVYGEKSGSSKLEGRAKKIAEEIGAVLKMRFQEQGWISAAS